VLWCCDKLEAAELKLPSETDRYRRQLSAS
jgi:hypothetical protein